MNREEWRELETPDVIAELEKHVSGGVDYEYLGNDYFSAFFVTPYRSEGPEVAITHETERGLKVWVRREPHRNTE